ncbi:undecaprenyl-diphosphatase [Neobacillus sp. K501]
MDFNIELFRMINDLGKEFPAVNPSMVIIAEYMVLFLALSVIVFWFTRKNTNRMMVICGGFSFILAEIIGKLAGKIHSNQNPFAELSNVNKLIEKAVDNSFPSDHTILFFSFCVTFWLFKKGWGFLWILLAFLVGTSRIWVGVHYPADVFVGAVISALAAAFVYNIVPRLQVIQKLLAIYEKAERAILPAKGKSKEF